MFGSEDSAITYGELSKAGVPIEPPVEFTRPVKVDGKERDARFRTVRMKAGVVPYGRAAICHHFARPESCGATRRSATERASWRWPAP